MPKHIFPKKTVPHVLSDVDTLLVIAIIVIACYCNSVIIRHSFASN